jgi:hypothetical protein
MSLANQANETLKAILGVALRIEKQIGNDSPKGEKGKARTEGGGGANIIREAAAIGGLATSMTKLITAADKMKTGSGKKVKDFLIDFSTGIKEAAENLKEVDGQELIKSLSALGSSIGKFALGMVAVALLSPLVALGTLVFALSLKVILMSLNTANANAKGGAEAVAALMSIGKSIALFALTMVGIALVAPLFALGTLVFALSVKAIIWSLNSAKDTAKGGADAVAALMNIGKGVLLFSLTMVGIGLVAPTFALGALTFGLALGFILLELGIAGKKTKEVTEGVNILKSLIKPIALFSIVLGVVGFLAPVVALGALTVSLSMLAVGGAAFLLGKLDNKGDVKRGALVIDMLALPMLAFAGALAIIGSLVKDDPKTLALKMLVIGGAIVGLGLAAYVLGQPEIAIFAEIGAGVLISLAAALLIFAGSLFLLSKAEFTKDKADNLAYAIATIGFSLAKFGLVAIPAAIGTAILIPASIALLPLSAALARFKTIDWQESDGEALKNALTSTVQGFAHALDGLGIGGMVKLLAAIPVIALIGDALVSLAAGVKAMATLSFTEMEYDKASGKLIPKRTVRLTNEEIQAVGPNTAMILNALAGPLTNFGKWATEGTYTFGPFSLGSGYMLKGIRAAAEVGNAISGIAKGVADMANLNIIEYAVKGGKIVPVSTRKLNQTDFELASTNTALILDTLTKPLSKFGKESAKGEGLIWGDGYVLKGIEAAAKVGNAIASIAKGVADMANLNVVEYVVKGGKLVPVSTRKLIDDDFTLAATNVDKILTALTKPLSDFGMKFKEGSTWFTDSGIEAGIDAIGKISDPISKLADMTLKLANGQANQYTVRNGKMVLTGVVPFDKAIPTALNNAKKLLNTYPQLLANVGIYIDKYEDEIDTAIDYIPKMASSIGKLADSMKKVGGSFDKLDSNKLGLYKTFVSITTGLTKMNTPFEKFTKLFGSFTKDMGSFVKTWEKFGKDDAEYLKSYADSLKTIASVDVGKLKEITNSIKEQAAAQAALDNKAKEQTSNQPSMLEKVANTVKGAMTPTPAASTPQPTKAKPDRPQPQPAPGQQLVTELYVTNLYINNKLVKN